ncbi:MAG TPA: hypothetical protein VMU22_00510 [Rhizomicrobium sp.]|nr:hypothetical protein [Rhizomicrobium sp.]
MRVLLSVTLAASLSGNIGAIAQSLTSPSAVTNPNTGGNAADSVAGARTDATRNTVSDAHAAAPQIGGTPKPFLLKDSKSSCAVLAIDGVQSDSITWSGRCVEGLADGPGTLAFSNLGKPVETITGSLVKGALQDGHIEIKWADGSSYVGNAVGSHMDGAGVLTTSTGDRFEGQWSGGHLNGQGSAVWANGDRYDGGWQDGKANGHGTQVWADGRKYDGEWQNDQPNGRGIVTRKDGTRFEADFVDGHASNEHALEAVAIVGGNAPAATATPASIYHNDVPAQIVQTDKNAAKPASDGAPHPQPAAIAGLSGKKLVAIDGSSLTLTTNDDGIAREIVAPNGTMKKNEFAFLSDRVGSVSDGEDGAKVVGVFRLTAKGIVTDYSDGRSEVLYPNTEGGVSMLLNAPSGDSFCMAWYPEGHHFSLDDRKAALAEYASKLGLDLPQPHKGLKPAAKPSCGTPIEDATNAPPLAPTHGADTTPKLTPIPKPERHASAARPPLHAATVTPASFAQPTGPVEVRRAIIHTIDADARNVTPGHEVASTEPHNVPSASASTCLSVESDGQHWSFRNHCGYDVQFAYCLMNASDPLASCDKGSISGSVSPNGSSALIADKSLSETNADHDFRWVACGGGAGEVVVHLDRSDPPTGRCVRRDAS